MEFVAVLVRTLKPGTTYESFIEAWYPEQGFDAPIDGPYLARNVNDEREILAFVTFELPDLHGLDEVLNRMLKLENARHQRIDDLIESTAVRGIYQVSDTFDFSTDASVARDRPAGLEH